MNLDRRDFLKALGFLTLGAALPAIPKVGAVLAPRTMPDDELVAAISACVRGHKGWDPTWQQWEYVWLVDAFEKVGTTGELKQRELGAISYLSPSALDANIGVEAEAKRQCIESFRRGLGDKRWRVIDYKDRKALVEV